MVNKRFIVLLNIVLFVVVFCCSCGENQMSTYSSNIPSKIITDQQVYRKPLKLLFYDYKEFAEVRKNETLSYKDMTSVYSSLYNGSAYDIIYDQSAYNSLLTPYLIDNSILKFQWFELSTIDVNTNIAELLGQNYETGITFQYSSNVGTVTFKSKLGEFEDLQNKNTTVDFKIGNCNCYIVADNGSTATVLIKPDEELFGNPNLKCTIATVNQSKTVIDDLKENVGVFYFDEVMYKECGMMSYNFESNMAMINVLQNHLSGMDIRGWCYLDNKQMSNFLENYHNMVFPVQNGENTNFNIDKVKIKSLTMNIGYNPDTVVTVLKNGVRLLSHKGNTPDYSGTKILGTFEKDGYSCTVYDTEYLDFVMVNGEQVIEGHYVTKSSDRTVETLKNDIIDIRFMTLSEMLDTYRPEHFDYYHEEYREGGCNNYGCIRCYPSLGYS